MDNAIGNTAAAGGLWSNPSVVSAIIALAGVVLGLLARDIGMAFFLARRKRADEVADRRETDTKSHRDLVRLYADPLSDAVTSLRFRLKEIVEEKNARYMLANAPHSAFLEYKRISTLYRIAAVLGWIRAIRRERSFLDPDQAKASVEMEAIGKLEKALADGDHVELHRLDELSSLWRVTGIEAAKKRTVAMHIDGARGDYLASRSKLVARELTPEEQLELARCCADIIRREADVEILDELVEATNVQSAAILGIKEAYLYRDWQAAIGDMMIEEDPVGARHFSVMGFGKFEDLYLDAHRQTKKRSIALRWFDRLEAIIHDLDMTQTGMFDARRELVAKLYACCKELEEGLAKRSATGSEPTKAAGLTPRA
jgi:hypothetical protein